jgi:hypothetical protein
MLEAAYGSVLIPIALARANMELLRQEIIHVDELIAKCETDLGSLTDSDRATAEAWMHGHLRSDDGGPPGQRRGWAEQSPGGGRSERLPQRRGQLGRG